MKYWFFVIDFSVSSRITAESETLVPNNAATRDKRLEHNNVVIP